MLIVDEAHLLSVEQLEQLRLLTNTDMDSRSPLGLILLDLLMPRSSGLEVCPALRPEGNSIPVVMLTGKVLEDDVEAGFARALLRVRAEVHHRHDGALPAQELRERRADLGLLVASLRSDGSTLMACGDLEHGACPADYAIVAVAPQTLATETVHEGGPDTPMGAATVALEVEGELWIGSFAGDRILRVPFPR